jgi:hypothetical protein
MFSLADNLSGDLGLGEEKMHEVNFCDLPQGEYFYFEGKEYHKINYGAIIDGTGKFVDFWEPETVLIEGPRYDRIFG